MIDYFLNGARGSPVAAEVHSISRLRDGKGMILGFSPKGKAHFFYMKIAQENIDRFLEGYNCAQYKNMIGKKCMAYVDGEDVVGMSMDPLFSKMTKKEYVSIKLPHYEAEELFTSVNGTLTSVIAGLRENHQCITLGWQYGKYAGVPIELVNAARMRWINALGKPPYDSHFYTRPFVVMMQNSVCVGVNYGDVPEKPLPKRQGEPHEKEFALTWEMKSYLLHSTCRADLIKMSRIGRLSSTVQGGLEVALLKAPVNSRVVDSGRETIIFAPNPYLRQMILHGNTILDVSVASGMR